VDDRKACFVIRGSKRRGGKTVNDLTSVKLLVLNIYSLKMLFMALYSYEYRRAPNPI